MAEYRSKPAVEGSLLAAWRRLAPLPGGAWLFSRYLGWKVPYTGSIGAMVRTLEPGHARITLRDRRAVRQHLGSVHAVALINLGEVTGGLAMVAALDPAVRGIVIRLSAEYFKKARGLLTAEARVTLPAITAAIEHPLSAEISDSAGDLVCRVTAVWRLEPRAARSPA
jgi:acyl-coenzyme A thioesterase PaaI-like protein